MSGPIVIVGAGGHAIVVAEALLAAGESVLGFTDRDTSLAGAMRAGLPVLGGDDVLAGLAGRGIRLANGLGGVASLELRESVQCRLEAEGWEFVGVRHPSAVVSRFSRVDPAAQLMAACVVQPGSVIGRGSIVNTAAIVEHDVEVGRFVHVACGAVVCGHARVGDGSLVGAAAVVRQGVALGARSVVGAGAAVVRDFAGHGCIVGVPARSMGATS